MELDRKIIKIDATRSLIFNGTVVDQMMTVTHIVDQANSKLLHFYHPDFMGKDKEKPFECSERKRIIDAVKRKYGVAAVKGFKTYQCKLKVTADANGNNELHVNDIITQADVVKEFAKHHLGIDI